MAAVTFLGERFTVINGVGLCILIAGVVLFNFLKYRKIKAGEIAVHPATPRKTIMLSPRRPPDGAHLLVSEPTDHGTDRHTDLVFETGLDPRGGPRAMLLALSAACLSVGISVCAGQGNGGFQAKVWLHSPAALIITPM